MKKALIWMGVLVLVTLAGCSGLLPESDATAPPPATDTRPAPEPTDTDRPQATETAAPEATPTEAEAEPTMDPADVPPRSAPSEFSTDFSQHSVPYTEILSGGPPKDGIPAIDDPQFISVPEADGWLEPQEPVILIEMEGEAKAYPLQVMTWHEIANDEIGGVPVVVTFCPLCNTGIAFKRTVDGQVLDFGTTGRLRFSNLIMYDRQTETWWQQASGEAIVGDLLGEQLEFVPATIISWEDFKTSHPDGRVLSRNTGFNRDYGRNPYAGYDDIDNTPFAYLGPDNSDRLPPMARVLTIDMGEEAVAYTYTALEKFHVINDEVGGKPVVVFWEEGTASALDSGFLPAGRDVGAAGAYSRDLDGQTLTFGFEDGNIVDEETGSVWDVLGQAVEGPLAGESLEPVVSVNHFWFSWAAFKPETRVVTSQSLG